MRIYGPKVKQVQTICLISVCKDDIYSVLNPILLQKPFISLRYYVQSYGLVVEGNVKVLN